MSEATVPTTQLGSPRRLLWMIALCFLLSGFAALLYETVWLRQFAIVLGTSEQALAVILASYMGGLAFGSWLASRWVDSIRRPVWTYGLLELGIAICAVAMPLGLKLVERVQVLLFGGVAEPPAAGGLGQTIFDLTACFGLILLPTAMMGATLPLLAKHVIHRDREIGPRIGLLYGINTLGAVAGTLAAAFVFLPRLGLRNTTLVGAAINGLIFLVVYLVARQVAAGGMSKLADDGRQNEPEDNENAGGDEVSQSLPARDDRRYRLVLWFAAAAGGVAFCYEIIFTRMLSHLLGGSVYAFATMLAGFLLGIALGGAISSRFAVRRTQSAILLAYAQSLAGICALLAYRSIDTIAGWSFEQQVGTSTTFSQVTVSMMVLLPTATCIGATFPLATRVFARDESEAASASARVYFWNTLGGIAGALVTGIFILPTLAYQGATFFAIAVNASIAIALVLIMRLRFIHIAAGCIAFAMLMVIAPKVPDNVMRVSALDGQPIEGDMIFNEVGRSGTVVLFDNLGDTRFFTNGLPEAIVGQRGTQNPFESSGAWLSAIPPLMHPPCDSMLIIGLGGGVAAAHVPPSVESIDVFELEPAVIDANEFIADRRNRDPLQDSRINMVLNDGRNGLALTEKKYDAIVSQPSHPWTAGASHLYTREFATTVGQRLNEGGVFLQWMNTDFIDAELFRALSATLLDVFPHVRVYEPFPGNLLFIASNQPIAPEAVSDSVLPMADADVPYYRDMGILTPTHLFAHLRVTEQQLREIALDAPLITDEFNLLAMRAPGLLENPDRSSLGELLNQHSPLLLSPESIGELCPSLQPVVLGMRLLGRDWNADLANAFATDPKSSDRQLYQALLAKADGDNGRCVELLLQMTENDPADPRPAFLILAYGQLGTFSLEPSDERANQDRLRERLDEQHQELLEAIEALVANDLDTVRSKESVMAQFGIDDPEYELAIRMRVLWRIFRAGPDMRQRNQEALELIAEAVPLVGSDALIPFRVAAAIGAGQGDVAIASVVDYSRSVVDRIKQQKVTDPARMETLRSNLMKCDAMISGARGMPGVSNQRFEDAVSYLRRVIDGDI